MESAAGLRKGILHDRGVRSDFHIHIQYRDCHGEVEVAANAVCCVESVLMHPQVNIVRRLNVIAHVTWIADVASRHSILILARVRYRRRDRHVLQDSGKIAGILPIDRVEIEILKTERHVKLVASDRACALAENWPQAFFPRRRKGLQHRIVRECDTRGGRSNRQLRDLNAHSFIDRSEAREEIALKVSLVPIGN